jgi:hypothetical protein
LEALPVFGSNEGWLGAPDWPVLADGDPGEPGSEGDDGVDGEPDEVLGGLLEVLGEPDDLLGDPCLP